MANREDVEALLNLHYDTFMVMVDMSARYGHPNPSDTRSWSQILVSMITGIRGLERKKGADLEDGSDVKAANVWGAIDTPRFNGVIKAGTKSEVAGTIASLDQMPFLFFVMWDHTPTSKAPRCRVWVVRPQHDPVFRGMCQSWYQKRERNEITSNNFQLHPPRNLNSDVFRNTCGNLSYPLLYEAHRNDKQYATVAFNPDVMARGVCTAGDSD